MDLRTSAQILGEFLGRGWKGAVKAILWKGLPADMTPEMVRWYLQTAVFEYLRDNPWSSLGVAPLVQLMRTVALYRALLVLKLGAVGASLLGVLALGLALVALLPSRVADEGVPTNPMLQKKEPNQNSQTPSESASFACERAKKILQGAGGSAAPLGFAGTWRGQDGRVIHVTQAGGSFSVDAALSGQDAKYFALFSPQGDTLVSKHVYTVAEVQEKFQLPAALVNKVAGVVPVQMILELSTDECAIRSEHDELSGVDIGQLYHNGAPTNTYRINSFVPSSTFEVWERLK